MLGAAGVALVAALTVGMAVGPATAYVARVRGTNGGGGTPFGEGQSAGANMARFRDSSSSTQAQLPSAFATDGGFTPAGSPQWQEYVFDGATLEVVTAAGAGSVAAVPTTTDVVALLARIATTPTQADVDGEVLWALTYPRVLAPAERSVARAAMEDWLGI